MLWCAPTTANLADLTEFPLPDYGKKPPPPEFFVRPPATRFEIKDTFTTPIPYKAPNSDRPLNRGAEGLPQPSVPPCHTRNRHRIRSGSRAIIVSTANILNRYLTIPPATVNQHNSETVDFLFFRIPVQNFSKTVHKSIRGIPSARVRTISGT